MKRSWLSWMALAGVAGVIAAAGIACGSNTATPTPSPGVTSTVRPQGTTVASPSTVAPAASTGSSPSGTSAAVVYYNNGSAGAQAGIVVTGTGTKTVMPDLGKLYLGIEARAATVTDAREQSAKAMGDVRSALRGLGVDEADMVTTSFTISPEVTWIEISDSLGRHTEPRIVGYIVSNQMEVTVRDLAKLGQVIDTSADKGGNLIRINSIVFTVDNPNAEAASTRQLAAQDAQAKAQLYAQAMGVTLGPLVYLTENSSSSPILAKDLSGREAAAGAPMAPTPITPGTMDLTTTITAVFSIAE